LPSLRQTHQIQHWPVIFGEQEVIQLGENGDADLALLVGPNRCLFERYLLPLSRSGDRSAIPWHKPTGCCFAVMKDLSALAASKYQQHCCVKLAVTAQAIN